MTGRVVALREAFGKRVARIASALLEVARRLRQAGPARPRAAPQGARRGRARSPRRRRPPRAARSSRAARSPAPHGESPRRAGTRSRRRRRAGRAAAARARSAARRVEDAVMAPEAPLGTAGAARRIPSASPAQCPRTRGVRRDTASTTESVTSTSPPRARATTREARLIRGRSSRRRDTGSCPSGCRCAARALLEQAYEAHRPVDERLHVVADHHHLVADRLHHSGVVRQRVGHALDEALHQRERLLLALLLGEARVAGQVGERDRDPHAAALDIAPPRARPPCARPRPAPRSARGSAGARSPSAARRAAAGRAPGPPSPRPSGARARPRASAARARTGGTAAPRRRRSATAPARRRGRAGGTPPAGIPNRAPTPRSAAPRGPRR